MCDGRFFHGLSAAFVLSWIVIFSGVIFGLPWIVNAGVVLAGAGIGTYFLRVLVTKPFSRRR